MNRRRSSAALVLGLALALTACAGSPPPAPVQTSDPVPEVPAQHPWEGEFAAYEATGTVAPFLFAAYEGYEVTGATVAPAAEAGGAAQVSIEFLPTGALTWPVTNVVFDAEGNDTGYNYTKFVANSDGTGHSRSKTEAWQETCPGLSEHPPSEPFTDILIGSDGLVQSFVAQLPLSFTFDGDPGCAVYLVELKYQRVG